VNNDIIEKKRIRVLKEISQFLQTHEEVEIVNWKTGISTTEWRCINKTSENK
jgi:hypothetical protein